jgi:hypothetical protein
MFASRLATLNSDVMSDEYAVSFPTGDYLSTKQTLSSVISDGDGFMISMWIYLHDGRHSANQVLFGAVEDSDNSYEIGITSLGQLYFDMTIDGNSSSDETNDLFGFIKDSTLNGWMHLVLSHKDDFSQTFRIIKNGADVRSLTDSLGLGIYRSNYSNGEAFTVGARNNQGTIDLPCDGITISEFALYKGTIGDVLSGETFMNNRTWYNHSEGQYKDYLYFWYRFGDGHEEAQGNTIYDMSKANAPTSRDASAIGGTEYIYLDNGKYPFG